MNKPDILAEKLMGWKKKFWIFPLTQHWYETRSGKRMMTWYEWNPYKHIEQALMVRDVMIEKEWIFQMQSYANTGVMTSAMFHKVPWGDRGFAVAYNDAEAICDAALRALGEEL